jgi:hypothetical protein
MTRPIIFLLIIIVVIFIPSVISAEPQGFSKLIIRYLAIDRIDDEFEVTVCAYLPKATKTFSANNQIISGKGKTVNQAVLEISKITGKTVGLAHSNVILANDEACEYGLISTLDYLVAEYSLANNAFIMNAGESAKDVIKAAKDLEKDKGISILDVVEYNRTHVYSRFICLEQLYGKTFSPSKTALIGKVTLKEDVGIEISEDGASGNQEQSGGGSGGESSSSGSGGSSTQKKKFANEGDMVVLKNGRKVLDIKYEDLFNLNWAISRKDFGIFEFENYNDSVFTNAKISLFVYQNNADIKTKFENGKPICEIHIKPKLMLNEINQDMINQYFYSKTFHASYKEFIENANKKISLDFSKSLKKTIDENIDFLDLYEMFYTNNTEEFKEFLKHLENPDDYISKIEIRINVDTAIVE